MSTTTAPPVPWHKVVTQDLPILAMLSEPVSDTTSETAIGADADHVDRITVGESPKPDQSAHRRMAELLHHATGWDIFPESSYDRSYVSRLWAEDWNSPEDSVYDDTSS